MLSDRGLRLIGPLAVALLLVSSAWTKRSDAQEQGIRGVERTESRLRLSPGGAPDARIFALVVGIDAYQRFPPLKGAVADARDIERSLRRSGVTRITTLIDAAATRAAMAARMASLIADTRAGDLVILSFAGHGSQEPSRVATQENGGKDEVFILAGFDPDGPGVAERLLDKDIFGWLARLDAKGVSVVFVADTCHGGGLSKTVDERIGQLSYRSLRYVGSKAEANAAAGTYYIPGDRLAGPPTATEATAADDLKHLTFMAAVDKWSKAPEIAVSDEATLRGAISYAFARAIEGKADLDGDGRVTRRELIDYIRNTAHDLTERKQEPVFAPLAKLDDVIFEIGQPQKAGPPAKDQAPGPSPPISAASAPSPQAASAIIRVGVVNGPVPPQASLGALNTPFYLSPANGKTEGLDAVWDAANGDVVSGLGDVVARRVSRDQLSGVVDRLAAVRKLAVLAQAGAARLTLTPDKRTYRAQDVARLQVGGVDGRYLIIANISGNGRIQFVYPIQGDDPMVLLRRPGDAKAIGDIYVKPPFGSEVAVAVASRQRLTALEEQLVRHNNQQYAREFVDSLTKLPAGTVDIGFLSFFTEP